jgi:hypothetical protein
MAEPTETPVASDLASKTAPAEGDVLEAMKDVVDPELGINVVDRLADHEVGQHRGGRLRDRAPLRVVRDVLDDAVDDMDAERHLVAAGRVHVVHLDVVRLPQSLVVGVAVVVEDDLLVQRIAHAAQNSWTRWIPSSSASISASVL